MRKIRWALAACALGLWGCGTPPPATPTANLQVQGIASSGLDDFHHALGNLPLSAFAPANTRAFLDHPDHVDRALPLSLAAPAIDSALCPLSPFGPPCAPSPFCFGFDGWFPPTLAGSEFPCALPVGLGGGPCGPIPGLIPVPPVDIFGPPISAVPDFLHFFSPFPQGAMGGPFFM